MKHTTTLEDFVDISLQAGRNSLKSHKFEVMGIGRLKTKKIIREAMLLKNRVIKSCLLTGRKFVPNYELMQWDEINKA